VGQVSLRGLQKSQGKGNVDHVINLIVRDGGRLVFMAASDCGKSTTLRTPTMMDSLPKHLSLDTVWPLGFDADPRLAA
jgi:ABC-type sugar transport system ATPase subunit